MPSRLSDQASNTTSSATGSAGTGSAAQAESADKRRIVYDPFIDKRDIGYLPNLLASGVARSTASRIDTGVLVGAIFRISRRAQYQEGRATAASKTAVRQRGIFWLY